MNPAETSRDYAARLNELLLESGMEPLDEKPAARFSVYLELLLKWNRRLNLTAIRTAGEILQRHFVESIFCARNLPSGIETLLDYGSGGGFPGIPIACCREEIAVTLGESSGKKAVFLKEVVRTLGLSTAVYGGRCENLPPGSFAAVTLRAVDEMGVAVKQADTLLASNGWLALLISSRDADVYRREFHTYQWLEPLWLDPLRTPGSERGVLVLGQRSI